jgi:hypothetical protein
MNIIVFLAYKDDMINFINSTDENIRLASCQKWINRSHTTEEYVVE